MLNLTKLNFLDTLYVNIKHIRVAQLTTVHYANSLPAQIDPTLQVVLGNPILAGANEGCSHRIDLPSLLRSLDRFPT